MSTHPPIGCKKDSFELDAGAHFLNCAYFAPLPKSVAEAGVRGLQRKLSPTPFASSEFFPEVDQVRRRFAHLVGGSAERVALLPSTSYGTAIAARNLPVARGQNVVILGEQFPSNVYVWLRRANETGGTVRTVDRPGPPPSGRLWNERVLEAIDSDTAVVTVPPCHWTDGTLFDLESIRERADETGSALVIDGGQLIGAGPFDVRSVRPDAMIAVGYKWLLGPYATALGYFGPRFDGGVPLEETWIGRAGSEDFQALVDYTDEYRPGAARYDVGQTSNFILVPMLCEALRLVEEWCPERIGAYCQSLLSPLAEFARAQGWPVEDEAWRADHMMGVRLPAGLDLGFLDDRMQKARVYASLRGDALRVSPHVYNDGEDIAALIDVLKDFAHEGGRG